MLIIMCKWSQKITHTDIHHFRNEKGTGVKMLLAVVSGIVTSDAPVSYIRDFKIQRRERRRESKKKKKFL